MNIEKLNKILEENGQPKFRTGQIIKAVFQDGVSNFSEISNLPKILRQALDKNLKILSFEAENILMSGDKLSVKASLKLQDGNLIETVLLSPKLGIWSICLSCQVGCPMKCAFCATGLGGFKRNLSQEEITDQILFWKQWIRNKYGHTSFNYRLANIVFMGMGEPFLNWKEVKNSLEILIDKNYFNFGSRSISVSTVGVSDGIKKFVSRFPQINLAISLHFSDDKKRSQFMPANNFFNLAQLKDELKKYFNQSNRKVFLEYILFGDINESAEDAEKLIAFIKSFLKYNLLHVNLIRYNETSENFKPSSHENTEKFKEYLKTNGIKVTIRKSLGSEIQGACGQLAGKIIF
jgi:23S rRNA (adenine(2503)-C(2))-methyltransferase